MADDQHHVIVCEQEGALVSSCVCVVIPNLTRGDCRHRGYATACPRRAADIARGAGCYKIMLLTGAKDEATLCFYRRSGFDSGEKTAFIMRLD